MCAANQAMSPCLPKFTATNSAHLNRNDLQDERCKHIWEGEGLDALKPLSLFFFINPVS